MALKLPEFGIALSGGGARGLAHIGVLAALRKTGSFLVWFPAQAWVQL